MSVDLAEFVAHGAAPEFAAFRAHYPRCADCAAEVRAWTELHATLSAPAHPSPDTLLRYEDARLPEPDRRAVADHLAACAPCRDELRALAAFDREAARVALPAAAARPRWFRLPELGRLVLHPALAYGLVLALLFYPALTGRRQAPEPAADRVAALEKSRKAAEPKPAEQSAAAGREERAAPAAPPAAASSRPKADAFERENVAPLARLKAVGGGDAGLVVSLGSEVQTRVDAQPTAGQLTLRIPLSAAFRGGRPLEVRVLDERGERELRERVTTPTDVAEVHVPRAWLTAGRYRVELRAVGSQTAPDTFSLDVGN